MVAWLFAHGSLMIEPPFPVVRSEPAVVEGWRRSFGHPSVRNWGNTDAPAPTSALVAGGTVRGIAHLVADDVVRQVVAREASEPVEVTPHIGNGQIPAQTWLMSDRWAHLPASRLAQAALRNVAAGGGPLGNALDYLVLVHRALALQGVSDEPVERYLAACRAAGITSDSSPVHVTGNRDEDL